MDSMRNRPLYQVGKAVLPRAAQIGLRKVLARWKRRSVADVWPILESAGRAPEGWTGWPEGKRFAFVLTHDVEMQRGLDRCRMVMDVEERQGIRSAFYCVPERRYELTDELCQEMIRRGFEVGVQGLYHDLSLFSSEAEFRRQAIEINRYFKKWNSVGFRCPYMIRNLPWMRDYLDIEYDTSTFDTDPFEPQPKGVGTIFPFIIDGKTPGRKGFVELPYTITQDLTLFVLLGEKGIDIVKKKVDWIVERGGMILFDTHPDYMQEGHRCASDEYPLRYYEEFLEYVTQRYAGQYWQALPRDVSTYCRQNPETVRHGIPKRVCMVAYSFYESDGRIIRYAETLARQGCVVDAIALGKEGLPPREEIHGVNVERIQARKRNERNQFDYLIRMIRFLFGSSRALIRKHSQNPYDIVHVHSIPDFEVFAAWYPKRKGARVILDIHDLVPEFYASKFNVGETSVAFKILLFLERISARFADHIIIPNHIWREKLVGRSVPPEKCTVVLNNVDPTIFYRHQRTRSDGKVVILYPGGLQWHQGVDIIIRAFPRVAEHFPEVEFHIYGDGSERVALENLIRDLRMSGKIRLNAPVPIREVPLIMANADLGVVAKRADSFGNEAYSTKIMEYMSQGLPVIASRTKIDTYYFNDREVKYFESGNEAELADALIALIADPDMRHRFSEKGLDYVSRNDWNSKKHEYLNMIDALCHHGESP